MTILEKRYKRPANFGRVYAAYGGSVVVLSLVWGWRIERVTPDRFDITGGMVALSGCLYHHVLARKMRRYRKMTDERGEKISPFACDMSAIETERRGEHTRTTDELFRAVEEMRELADGYAFRLANDGDILLKAAQFIALEKLCCPFFAFALEVEAEGGAVWLSLTGREGVKPFIMAEIGGHLTKPAGRQGNVNPQ